MNIEYNSQFGQDKILNEEYFFNKKDGFFVDIGAYDGVELSNSKFFEDLGWDGVCVEANPIVFKKLIENRKCKCINSAVNNVTGEVDFLLCEGYPIMLSGILDNYNKRHLDRVGKEIEQFGGKKEVIKINAQRFDEIIDKEQKIDVLFIDVEGSEFNILETIRFDQYKIDYIVFEDPYGDHDYITFFKIRGYEYVKSIGCDKLYKRMGMDSKPNNYIILDIKK